MKKHVANATNRSCVAAATIICTDDDVKQTPPRYRIRVPQSAFTVDLVFAPPKDSRSNGNTTTPKYNVIIVILYRIKVHPTKTPQTRLNNNQQTFELAQILLVAAFRLTERRCPVAVGRRFARVEPQTVLVVRHPVQKNLVVTEFAMTSLICLFFFFFVCFNRYRSMSFTTKNKILKKHAADVRTRNAQIYWHNVLR